MTSPCSLCPSPIFLLFGLCRIKKPGDQFFSELLAVLFQHLNVSWCLSTKFPVPVVLMQNTRRFLRRVHNILVQIQDRTRVRRLRHGREDNVKIDRKWEDLDFTRGLRQDPVPATYDLVNNRRFPQKLEVASSWMTKGLARKTISDEVSCAFLVSPFVQLAHIPVNITEALKMHFSSFPFYSVSSKHSLQHSVFIRPCSPGIWRDQISHRYKDELKLCSHNFEPLV